MGSRLAFILNALVALVLVWSVTPIAAAQQPSGRASGSFADALGSVRVGAVKAGGPVEVPFITWGGDVATFHANGGLTTAPGSIYQSMGLNLKLVNGDDFPNQVKRYLAGDSPFLRAELRMIGLASEVLGADPRTKPVVILQLTWSAGDARIHLLSPDIRRPGRVGDLIIPVLDPEGEDRAEFLRWMLKGLLPDQLTDGAIKELDGPTAGYSAAAFASLRSRLKAEVAERTARGSAPMSVDDIVAVVRDQIQPAIGQARRYQTLQALVNCTRRSLLPNPEVTDEEREQWHAELRRLEANGIR